LGGHDAGTARKIRQAVFVGDGILGQGGKPARTRAARMVEAIVNRNKPPAILKLPRGMTTTYPLFPERYDWKEEDRVRGALRKLFKDTSAELWEELLRKRGDPRYCITATSGTNEDSMIESVGDICAYLAYFRLVHVFERHLPRKEEEDLPWEAIDVDLGIKDLAEWRKERKDKSLYQLQIEVCERGIRGLAKVKDLPPPKKALVRIKTRGEIRKLRRTKRPVLLKMTPGMGPSGLGVFHDKQAKIVREAVRSGKKMPEILFK
jgi:hypothetical protein